MNAVLIAQAIAYSQLLPPAEYRDYPDNVGMGGGFSDILKAYNVRL
jgi:hypothetical protein